MISSMHLSVCLGILVLIHAEKTLGEPLYQTETNLKQALLTNYDKTVPPLVNSSAAIEVKFGLSLIDIANLDEKNSVLTTHIWVRLAWTDQRLAFKPSEHAGLDHVAIPYDLLWRPDIVPYSLAQEELRYSPDYQAVVSADGSVLFIPHTRLMTRCSIDLTRYPYDTQACSIKFGSWVYHGNIVSLSAYDPGFDTTDMIHSNQWELVESTYRVSQKYYPCCPEPYPEFTATITLRRHSRLLANMYVGPGVAIGIVLPVTFLLPAYSSYKLVFGGSLLVSQLLVMGTLMQTIPTTHIWAPAIALYMLGNVILILLSLACSAVVIFCSQRAQKCKAGVPMVIDKVFLGVLSRLVCARRENYIEDEPTSVSVTPDNHVTDDSATMVKEYTRLVAPAEWRQLAVVLDRLLFVIFTFGTIFTMSTMVTYSH